MTKSIKIDDKTHRDLEELQLKHETFSQTVARLITLYRGVTELVWRHTVEHPRAPGQGG